MQIVDAHHHLWDLDACHYPWLMASGVKRFFGDPTPIQNNYLVADFREDAVEFDLLNSVHIQVGVAEGDELAESAWLEQTAANDGLPGAIVAFCDLASEDAIRAIEAQLVYPRVRGVRQIVGRSADEDAKTGSDTLIDNPVWRSNLASLADLELSFDLQLIPEQVERIYEVLKYADRTPVALCHCGSPWDQSPSGLAGWRDGLQLLASLPQVHCKLSGFGMFDHQWTVESIRPIVESCIDVFGIDRCMFGSNFPVDKLHSGYSRLWKAYGEITRPYGDTAQHKLCVDNARSFYRLSTDSS